MGGVNAAQENNKLVQKQIKVLENSLDKNLTKFNETLAQNKVLRTKIDEYRRERVVFDGIYKKLERDLHEKKQEMAAIIEDSKNAYNARDKSQSEQAALQLNANKERAEFENEFKEVGQLIKDQQLQLEQLRLKQFEKNPTGGTLKIQDATAKGSNESSSPAGSWVGKQDKIAPLSQEKIHSYEESLQKIQDTLGIYDINEIVTRFLEAEEQNFSLFNYVNDINTEIERLEHSISDMRSQIEKFRGQGMSSDTQRKKTMRDLDERLAKTERKASEYESRHQSAVRTITHLKHGIQSISTRIGASSNAVDEMLGNQGITESNMMQYLGIIEQRTCEILQAYASAQTGAGNDNSLQLPTITADGATARVDVRVQDADELGVDDEDEEDERPLTIQELTKKTMTSLSNTRGKTPLRE